MTLGQPPGDGRIEFVQMAGEKVVGVFHNNQAFFSLERRYQFLHFCSWTELIVGSVNKQPRLAALCQKRKVTAVHGDTDSDQFAHARIAAGPAFNAASASTRTICRSSLAK